LAVLKNDTVEIWDVTTGEKLLTPPGPIMAAADGATNLWFSPDGKRLVISGCTGTAVLLDAASGAEIRRFSGNVGCLRGVAFSPDGKLLAVNNNRRGLKIWDIETGQELLTLPGGYDVRFTPDGTRVVVANIVDVQRRQFVGVYLLRLEDIVALAKSRLTRSLTTTECQQYLHVETCPAEP
jgi:WD40 repeat protein